MNWRNWLIHLFFKSSWCKIDSTASNWINSANPSSKDDLSPSLLSSSFFCAINWPYDRLLHACKCCTESTLLQVAAHVLLEEGVQPIHRRLGNCWVPLCRRVLARNPQLISWNKTQVYLTHKKGILYFTCMFYVIWGLKPRFCMSTSIY